MIRALVLPVILLRPLNLKCAVKAMETLRLMGKTRAPIMIFIFQVWRMQEQVVVIKNPAQNQIMQGFKSGTFY